MCDGDVKGSGREFGSNAPFLKLGAVIFNLDFKSLVPHHSYNYFCPYLYAYLVESLHVRLANHTTVRL
jgi:hypothetical protein